MIGDRVSHYYILEKLGEGGICTIHEVDETADEHLYICMTFYEGESLREKIKKGRFLLLKR